MSGTHRRVERVEWHLLPKDEFDRIVDVLLTTHYRELGYDADAVDGRGGDDGIDIDVRDRETQELLHVFQVKYFPEGFPTAHKSRRTQIRRSFRAAETHEPDDWTLVMPSKGTPGERKFVTGLKSEKIPRTHTMGTVELDQLMVKHPNVNDWAVRSAVNEALRLVGRPEVLARTAAQFQQAIDEAAARGDRFSPFWGHRLGSFDGKPVVELYAKRSDAPEKEPLSTTFNLNFGPDDQDLRTQWRDTVGYGRHRRVTLPAKVVRSIVKRGPEDWHAEELGPSEVIVDPVDTEHRSVPAYVVLEDDSGAELARLDGRTIDQGAAAIGGLLELELEGGLNQVWRFPRGLENAETSQTLNIVGHSAREAARTLRFLDAFDKATVMTLHIRVAEIPARLALPATVPKASVEVAEYVEDLAVIERLADVTLLVPESLPATTPRIWARITRMLLEGRRPAAPSRRLHGGLTGTVDDDFVDQFTYGAMIYVPADPASKARIEIEGRSVPVPPMSMAHPNVVLENVSRTDKGLETTFRINDGTPFRLFCGPEVPEGDASVFAMPDRWEITGIPEAEDVFKRQ